ncbi:DNA recombination protein RmuC [Kushneria sinocarnis]|uniref:DNA recombination protein RmuC n=1 Tax=Kushneria sinocarnis TaxID=595502 RepID=A0A420X1S1_9GAMM|nr:DNA recombination protein RmuC [Kushneria sinocarnis]RKR07615.1 DNA recombination protein RmuC [Kushneria sinocarnis]
MESVSITAGVAGLLAGLVIGAVVLLSQRRRHGEREAELEEQLDDERRQHGESERLLAEREALLSREQALTQEQRQQLGERDRRLERLAEELAGWQRRAASLETAREQEQSHHAEQLRLLESARHQLKEEFEQLAGRIFEERSARFSQQSREGLNALLTPFREQVEQFRSRVEALHGEQERSRAHLNAQLEQLAGLNRQMSEEAVNLTRALKGDNKAQGGWGELMLETVLERAGLRKGEEYEREVARQGEQGIGRPDAVIHLPEQRHLIVDAKVSLTAWSEVMAAETDEERQRAMKAHLRSVRNHVDGLARRDYPSLTGLNAPDMVFLFLPIEPAFAAIFRHDDTLFQQAFDRHVVIVTPTTLLASLRTVASLWRLERQNDNARGIVERAEKLLDKFHGFVSSMEDIGTHLHRAGNSHQQAMDRLRDGQGSLVAQAHELNRLGARMKKELPASRE